ncbi:DUF5684 domain-containing protein, partial [Agromyces terreus]|uniref:DUF5684 domain-containing protein n=1 Tax=Agromyces terreus TaxID=424795 RepID=UPI0031D326E1
MTPEEAQQIAVASLLTSGLSLVIGLGVYVWYAIMLAKVLAQFGRPGWAAWIPVYNEMQVFRIGGQQPWLALLLYVPLVQIVGLVFKVFALHRISTQSWRGVGTTILGVLLPPVWATVLAVGPSPDPERGRMPRGPVSGAIPPVQPNGPLAAPHPGAAEPVAPFGAPPAGPPAPAAPGSAPLPVWLVPGAPVPPAPPQGAPLPFDPPQGAPFEPAPAPQHPGPAAGVAP